MAKQIALTLAKVKGSNNSADIIDQVNINTGNRSPVHVRAVDNVYYQLTDLETQYGPENIMTERVGNDLYVAFEGESIETPSLNYRQLLRTESQRQQKPAGGPTQERLVLPLHPGKRTTNRRRAHAGRPRRRRPGARW